MNGILGVIVFVMVTLPLMMLAWPLIAAGWIILGIAGVLGLIGATISIWQEK